MSDIKEQAKVEDAKTMANGVWAKYMVLCGKVYDFFAALLRGQRKHTPETLKISQKRGTWIVSLFIVFAVLGAFMDEEEASADNESNAEDAEISTDDREEIAFKGTEKEASTTLAVSTTKSVQTKPAAPYQPTRFVYVCSDCGTVVVGQSQPRSTKCPKGKYTHQWFTIGSHGDTSYQCGKCGAAIQMKATPNPGRCPKGLGHNWERL